MEEELALTRFATASSHSFTVRRPSQPGTAFRCLALLVCGLLGPMVGCKSKKTSSSPDGSMTAGTCAAATNSTSGNATTLTSTQPVEGKVCFAGTSDWYVINVPSGNTLLDVAAGYPSTVTSPVVLDVKVYTLSGTELTELQELTANATDAGANSIQTTLLALQSGPYYLQVADAHGVNFDATNSYTLTVGYAMDPDTHEPNDSPSDAKPSDGKPGYLAYLNDLDVFVTNASSANDLLQLTIGNPMTAPGPVNYTFTAMDGTILGEGSAVAQSMSTIALQPITASGTYYATLSAPAGTVPGRTSAAAYSIAFNTVPNPDTMNNHTIATAVCPGGGSGPCTMAYSGTTVTLPTESSYISVPGQADFYRVDVTSGAPLVLQMSVTSAMSTPVKYAVDLLLADPNSPCSVDTDCQALNTPCTPASQFGDAAVASAIESTDCEISHGCLQPGNYKFCPGTKPCSLCEGAGLCIQTASGGQCAISQYQSAVSSSGKLAGGSSVATAQPLFSTGTYYVKVHDDSYRNTDLTNAYTLALVMAPEPDPNDQSTVACSRNNFYDPYPSFASSETANGPRAIDITAQVMAGTPVTGYISYQGDNDWYSFKHPCPGEDCALDITWVQPGPSPVQVAFYMLTQDIPNTPWESFAYTGTPTKQLSGPVTSEFDNQTCAQCSFASAKALGDGGVVTFGACSKDISGYTYYMRVADVTQTNWDFTNKGQYSFTIKKGAAGCPGNCSGGSEGCGCYCTADSGLGVGCPSPGF